MNIEALLSKFRNIKQSKQNSWTAECPCHDDQDKKSLSITLSNGKILLYCFAGCDISSILKNTNLTFSDLFLDKSNSPIAIYQYRNEDGTFNHEKLKYPLPDGKKRFTQRNITPDGEIVDNIENVKRIPYNLPELKIAIKNKSPILYLEGERDCNTAKVLGYTATTMGGASDWKEEYAAQFFKGANLYLIPDKDNAGLNLTGGKMIDSLKPVTKSLKCVILPQGKDLTEWVELGNQDLQPLLKTAIELPTAQTIPDPTMVKTISGFQFAWDRYGLRIHINRLNNETECEISVFDNDKLIHIGKCKLLSTLNIKQLKETLNNLKPLDIWSQLLTKVTQKCLEEIRKGLEVDNIDDEPTNEKIDYLIYPLLFLNEPTVIFAPGGSGKSTFMDYLCVLVAHGHSNGTGWDVKKANVLYLDWEDTSNTHKRRIKAIKKGLGITAKTNILYSHCDNSIFEMIEDIKKIVTDNHISFVVVDSQEACISNRSYAINDSQAVQLCHNLLRALNCTIVIVDHVSKASMNGMNSASPIGTVSKINRCRCEYEFSSDADSDSDELPCSLVQKKNNLTRLLSPFGLKFIYNFQDKERMILDSIKVKPLDLEKSMKLREKMTKTQKIIKAIKQNGGMATIADITNALEVTDSKDIKNINSLLSNKKNIFVSLGNGTYSLVTKNAEEISGENDVNF